jgi:hypothetical protein
MLTDISDSTSMTVQDLSSHFALLSSNVDMTTSTPFYGLLSSDTSIMTTVADDTQYIPSATSTVQPEAIDSISPTLKDQAFSSGEYSTHTDGYVISVSSAAFTRNVTAASNSTPIVCRCRCCTADNPKRCVKCCGTSLVEATSCTAAETTSTTVFTSSPSPSPPTRTVNNIEPAKPLTGSRYPERLELNPNFAVTIVATEQLFELPVAEQRRLGFPMSEMLVECMYDGNQCEERSVTGWNSSVAVKNATRSGRNHGYGLFFMLPIEITIHLMFKQGRGVVISTAYEKR